MFYIFFLFFPSHLAQTEVRTQEKEHKNRSARASLTKKEGEGNADVLLQLRQLRQFKNVSTQTKD